MTRELRVYSGRNRPDLGPVYRLFEALTDTRVTVEKIHPLKVDERVIREKADPGADLLLTNSRLAMERVAPHELFEPYRPAVATEYPAWLRAGDFTWVSFTAWPRVMMVNRLVLPDPDDWPRRLEDLGDERFRDRLACAGLVEMTTVAQFATYRAVRGDEAAATLLDRLAANRLRVLATNLMVREALVNEPLAAVFANSSNVHVFHLAGHPVAEAWLDQEEGGLGTTVESHTVGVLKGSRNAGNAREFVDFLLSEEVQTMLARLYGETPVNPRVEVPFVRPLSQIRRLSAPPEEIRSRMDGTLSMLRERGFE